jgi:DNA-directed RNA polymerase subunit omega
MSDSHQKLFEGYEKGPDQKWTIPNDNDSGVYRFILAAARRARQLQNGQRPLINTTLRKPTKIAMEEIRIGAVAVEIIPEGQPESPPATFDGADSASTDAFPGADAFGPVPESLDAIDPKQDSAAEAGPETSENSPEMPVAFRP